jgi:hypothetical protein
MTFMTLFTAGLYPDQRFIDYVSNISTSPCPTTSSSDYPHQSFYNSKKKDRGNRCRLSSGSLNHFCPWFHPSDVVHAPAVFYRRLSNELPIIVAIAPLTLGARHTSGHAYMTGTIHRRTTIAGETAAHEASV